MMRQGNLVTEVTAHQRAKASAKQTLFHTFRKRGKTMDWKTAWSYLPIDYDTSIGVVENITQRTFFWNNLNGSKIKVKFSNLYSKEPLILEKVIIGQRQKGSQTISNIIPITHLGKEKIVLEPKEEFYSDEVLWNIQAQTEIVVSIFIKEKTNIQSACSTWFAKSWQTVYGIKGDYTMEQHFDTKDSREIYPFVEADLNKSNIIVGISEIKLYTNKKVQTVALFGDSITHMSYYSDALMERVYRKIPGGVTILNRGIGGNRILNDASYVADMPGNGKCFGIAALKRFERDVYESECPDTVIILEGVNDMMHPYIFRNKDEIVSAKELQEGIEKLIGIAQQKGSKVYIGTVMPFRDEGMGWFPESESIRLKLNEWIRSQKAADGVVDFAQCIENKDNSEYMKDGTHIGDGLHPNREGGVLMAESIPMEWIRGRL
jgi:lysophospholipase L1-like esterase